jgi:hypothetical protein
LFAGHLLSALKLIYFGLQTFQFQAFSLGRIVSEMFRGPPLGLDPFGLAPFGFPSLDFQAMGFEPFRASTLPFPLLDLFSTRPLLGLKTFGLFGLGALGGTLLGCRTLGLNPFRLSSLRLDVGLLPEVRLEPLCPGSFYLQPGCRPLLLCPLQCSKINDLHTDGGSRRYGVRGRGGQRAPGGQRTAFDHASIKILRGGGVLRHDRRSLDACGLRFIPAFEIR